MMIFLYIILGIIVFVLVLGIIVLIHEAGHFLIAKKSGILCHEFSIGMGPLIWQTKKGETMFLQNSFCKMWVGKRPTKKATVR